MTRLGAFDPDALLRDMAVRATEAGYRPQILQDQRRAWGRELELLGTVIRELLESEPAATDWTLLLEYEIPRRQRRIDKVIIAGKVILVLEFKIGASHFTREARWQAEDYAHDLRDFHAQSLGYPVIPFLVATEAEAAIEAEGEDRGLQLIGRTRLSARILEIVGKFERADLPTIDAYAWDASPYQPTPTVIEATRRLFSGHSVRDLSHAYADNLRGTVDAVAEVIRSARLNGEHVLCLVTGVPGAGKTLAGLVGVHDPSIEDRGEHQRAFLSGNGPLVKILRAALAQDAIGRGTTRQDAERRVEGIIQNVHQVLEEYGIDKPHETPAEHVIVFDEAQRAWDAEKLAKRHPTLQVSEPSLVLDIMARKTDWSVVVALVGGGQEIHNGEAGLEEWGRAVSQAGHSWGIVASPEVVHGGTAVAHHRLFLASPPGSVRLVQDPRLHLSVSVRSPRAQHIAEWVNAVLDLRADSAAAALSRIHGFRLAFTRDLEAAKQWLRDASRQEQRPGLLASSGSLRHRAYGIEMAPEFHRAYPVVHWFLGPPEDVRSSYALEVAMTEFECQGLELDWVGVCWGDDLTIDTNEARWSMREFRGAKWRDLGSERKRQYLLNKYRVLMTRAREGMVIWIPPGDARDPTRDPKRLDRTAMYFARCGLQEVV